MLTDARCALGYFLGATDPDTIVFGLNTSHLALSLSRALSRTWGPEDEILVTDLDHDSNVSSWTLAARDSGARSQAGENEPERLHARLG